MTLPGILPFFIVTFCSKGSHREETLPPIILMATKKPEPVPPKKKSSSIAGEILDGVGWVVAEIALPVPDTLINMLKKKKKPDAKDLKKKK